MARWPPDTAGRLRQAALELFSEHPYEEVTTAEIAARAGLSERTFFRYFADKREVLFAGSEDALGALVGGVTSAPEGAGALDAVEAGLLAVAEVLGAAPIAHARRRAAVIRDNPALREREMAKMSHWAEAVADALRRRGIEEPAASLSAEVGLAAFRVAWARYVADGSDGSLPAALRDAIDGVRAVAAPPPRRPRGMPRREAKP